jgi:hypothetical protein
MKNKHNHYCVACSIFKIELDHILADKSLNIDVKYLSSMLHMTPEKLQNELSTIINSKEKENDFILVFGDCCPHMTTIASQPNVSRTKGINCIEIFLGKEKYRKMRKDGVFFLMPEWTLRWKEVFKFELKLEGDIAKDFMNEFHTKIVYLDTGQIHIPRTQIKEIEEYTGLEVEIMKVDSTHLVQSIKQTIEDLENKI